ncbi:hypothetical protein HNY73_016580 [Argiope bruennichi]|uniref:Uncharacterized protein n=1 Tax=Argiope bruennichi TaxID=94029 RepID=A0A8T0EN68_ARGBR|nr:hypothetical protein HNY73_016580 [Argiope bruennichi]
MYDFRILKRWLEFAVALRVLQYFCHIFSEIQSEKAYLLICLKESPAFFVKIDWVPEWTPTDEIPFQIHNTAVDEKVIPACSNLNQTQEEEEEDVGYDLQQAELMQMGNFCNRRMIIFDGH